MEQAIADFIKKPTGAPLRAFEGACAAEKLEALLQVAQTNCGPETLELAFAAFCVNPEKYAMPGPWLLSQLPMTLQVVLAEKLGDKAAIVKGLRTALALVKYVTRSPLAARASPQAVMREADEPPAKRQCAAAAAPAVQAVQAALPVVPGQHVRVIDANGEAGDMGCVVTVTNECVGVQLFDNYDLSSAIGKTFVVPFETEPSPGVFVFRVAADGALRSDEGKTLRAGLPIEQF